MWRSAHRPPTTAHCPPTTDHSHCPPPTDHCPLTTPTAHAHRPLPTAHRPPTTPTAHRPPRRVTNDDHQSAGRGQPCQAGAKPLPRQGSALPWQGPNPCHGGGMFFAPSGGAWWLFWVLWEFGAASVAHEQLGRSPHILMSNSGSGGSMACHAPLAHEQLGRSPQLLMSNSGSAV